MYTSIYTSSAQQAVRAGGVDFNFFTFLDYAYVTVNAIYAAAAAVKRTSTSQFIHAMQATKGAQASKRPARQQGRGRPLLSSGQQAWRSSPVSSHHIRPAICYVCV